MNDKDLSKPVAWTDEEALKGQGLKVGEDE